MFEYFLNIPHRPYLCVWSVGGWVCVHVQAELLNLLTLADERYKKESDAARQETMADECGGGGLGDDCHLWDAEFNRRWRLLQAHWLATNTARHGVPCHNF